MAVDDQFGGRGVDLASIRPVQRVVPEQRCQLSRRAEVVDGYQFQSGSLTGDSDEGAANSANAVDGNSNRHVSEQSGNSVPVRAEVYQLPSRGGRRRSGC